MADRPSKNYSEDIGKRVIEAYNSAIDTIISSKDPEKVLPEISKIAAVGLGGVSDSDYLGRIIADESIEEMIRAVALYNLDRNQGLEALSRASKKVHGKLVSSYVVGFVTQEKIKPEWSEEEELAKAVNDIYNKWIKPKEEKK